MTKFSEAVLGTMMFIGLLLIFLGASVASESIAPSLCFNGDCSYYHKHICKIEIAHGMNRGQGGKMNKH